MKTFAVCYGFRDEICTVKALSAKAAKKKVEDHIRTLYSNDDFLGEMTLDQYMKDLAIVVSDADISTVDSVDG